MEPARASEEMRTLQLHHAHQVCGIVAHSKDRGVASVAIRSLAIASCVLTEPREQDEVLEMLDKICAETGWNLAKVHSELKKAWGWEALPRAVGGLTSKYLFASPGSNSGSVPAGRTPSLSAGGSSQTATPVLSQGAQGHGRSQHQGQNQPSSHGRAQSQSQSHNQSQSQSQGRGQSKGPQQASQAPATTNVLAPAPMKAAINPLNFADFSLPNHPYQNWYEPPSRTGSYPAQAFF